MSDDDKIVDLFSEKRPLKKDSGAKFFQGFNYIRLNKDRNGNLFNAEHLRNYAEKVCYLVTVLREHDGLTWLYNYEVPAPQLGEFINKFNTQEFDGEIIDIDKYIPNNPA